MFGVALAPLGLPDEDTGQECRVEEGNHPIARAEGAVACMEGVVADRRAASPGLAGTVNKAGMSDWLAKWRDL